MPSLVKTKLSLQYSFRLFCLPIIFLFVFYIGLTSAHAQTTVNMSKDICAGAPQQFGSCTSISTVQIGDPVHYRIDIGNTQNSPIAISLQEDLPSGFVPASSSAPLQCQDSLGNAIIVTTASTNPYILDLTLPASEDVKCVLAGYFSSPGEIATNTVSETGGLASPSNVPVLVASDTNMPVDLSVNKTASTSGPLDLSAGPQSVTYTVTMTTDRDVYLDDYLTFYDMLSLFNDTIPINAQLNPSSVSCTTNAPGGGALTCPVNNDFSGLITHESWGAFASFGYGAPDPILLRAGDTVTLTYSITYSLPPDQICIADEVNGMNNRVFLGLANGSMSLADINSSNNDTANAGSVPVSFDIDLPVDPDCIPPGGGGMGKPPNPVMVSKSFAEYTAADGTSTATFPVPWDQQYVTYNVAITNNSPDKDAYDITLKDIYSNLTYTPNHDVQLYDVQITSCPASSVCTITLPFGWSGTMPAPQGSVNAINSYYDSAEQFKGKIDVLKPGETATYQVRLRLRNSTCDFAELQQPKRVRNAFSASYTIDYEDEFISGLMVPFQFVKSDKADIIMETTPPCDFAVNKTVISSPNEIEFGQAMNYTLEFQNGASPIQAGTLIDVLRIEQNYYALGLDVAYGFTCQDSPGGGVTNYLPSGSGTGTVSYVGAPHQGIRVMNHPGFVNFAPNAKLTCNVTVTIEKPADSDPYCFSNGTPTIGNAAIIDGSLFYNANQAWPLSPQNTMWDAVSSELPKCYHLIVNKKVSEQTTTPEFGPDLTYTISVINASGSGSTAGAINFPEGTSHSAWNGPIVTDTFQPAAFPVAPPQNTPQAVLDPCTPNGTDPCDWLAPLSTTGHEVGITKIPAGGSLTYSYSISPNFTPHEICNDLKMDFVIDGLAPQRWYKKAQSIMEDENICSLIRTNLEITKTLDVHPTLDLPSSASFVVDVNCTPPAGFDAVPMSQTLTPGALVKIQKNIVVGSQCEIVERTPDENLLPSHCDWLPPTYPDGNSFTADGSVEPHKLKVHNATICRFGDIEVKKEITGDVEASQGTQFEFGLDCGTPASTTYSASTAAGSESTVEEIPDGSSCTVTETTPEPFTDDLGRYCSWGTATYSPSATAIVDEDNVQTVTVTNPVTCKYLADLTIKKLILTLASAPSFDSDKLYSVSVNCIDSLTNQNVYSGNVSVSENTPATIEDIATPANCTITENLTGVTLPQWCTGWNLPSYSPSQSVSLAAQAGVSETITITNTPICPPTGIIRVSKILANDSSIPPAGTEYGYDMTCTDQDGVVTSNAYTIGADDTQSYIDFASTNCVITETPPAAPEGCQWDDPTYEVLNNSVDIASVNYTTHTGIGVKMVNTLNCMPEIQIKKELDLGSSGLTIPASTEFEIDLDCVDENGTPTVNETYALTAGESVTVSDAAFSQSCTVTEQPPIYDLPKHCHWASPDYGHGQTQDVNYTPTGAPQTFIVKNEPICKFGQLEVVKLMDEDSYMHPALPQFDINVTCGSDFDETVSLPANGFTVIDNIPAGVACTVTELPVEGFNLPDSCSWDDPVISQSQVELGDGQSEKITVTNKLSCTGDLLIDKSVTIPSGISIDPDLNFNVDVNCSLPDGSAYSEAVAVRDSNGIPRVVATLPVGTTCEIVEPTPSFKGIPSHCRWQSPQYPDGTNAEISAPGGQEVLTIENKLVCEYGSLRVEKDWSSSSQIYGSVLNSPNMNYNIEVNCANGYSQNTSIASGGSYVFYPVPANTSCTVTETLPPFPNNTPSRQCKFRSPSYSPSATVAVPPNTSRVVTVTNSAQCEYYIPPFEPPSIVIEKNIFGSNASAASIASYEMTVNCSSGYSTTAQVTPVTPVTVTMPPFNVGSCTVTETPPSESLLPSNCSWNSISIDPSQAVTPAYGNNAPTVTVTNMVQCLTILVPGKLFVEKELVLPPYIALPPTTTFDVNVTCMSMFNFPPWNSGSSTTVSVGAGDTVQAASGGFQRYCSISEPTPTLPLPQGCRWLAPEYPNGQGALLGWGNNDITRKVLNQVICEGAIKVEKVLHPDSEPVGDPTEFQVQVDCGAPTNSSATYTLSDGDSTIHTALLDTGCTITELPPPAIDQCIWAQPEYQVNGISVGGPINVETSLDPPVVQVINKLECDFGPPILNIQKTLIANQPCGIDPASGVYNCAFEITVTNTGGSIATGPFIVEDSLEGTLAYGPQTQANNGWDCDLPTPSYPIPLDPLSCTSPAGLSIPGGGTTSFVINVESVSLYPPTENCATMLDQDGQQIESCVDLPGPELQIEKTLLTPDCAENPTSECLFEITITNIGDLDFTGPFFINDAAGSPSGSVTLPTVITSGPNGGASVPNSGWFCFPPTGAPTGGAWSGHICAHAGVTISAGGGTSVLALGMDGSVFRQTDLPKNCASLLFSSPEQESCVDVPWSPGVWLDIDKSVVSCNFNWVCTFNITISTPSFSGYDGPISLEDVVTPTGGTYVSNTGNWTCSGTGTVTCDSNGDVIIGSAGSTSFELTMDLSSPVVPVENCVTITSNYQSPPPSACVPIEPMDVAELDIVKKKLTAGDCRSTSPLGPYLCEYSLTFTNISGSTYTGPLGFDDTVYTNLPPIGASAASINTPPGGIWSCSPLNPGPGFNCNTGSNIVTLTSGDSVTITFIVQHDYPRFDENCATLSVPSQDPAPKSCVMTHDLKIEKTKITSGDCTGMISSPQLCTFEITVTNNGGTIFDDYITVTDVINGVTGAPIDSYSNVVDWNCENNISAIDCTTNSEVRLLTAESITLTLTLDMANPAVFTENCASLTGPELDPVPTSCVDLEATQPILSIEKTKLSPHKCHEFPDPNGPVSNVCEFKIIITNQGPGDFSGDVVLDDTFDWGAPITGSSTPITWSQNPPWSCSSSPTGTVCSANNVSITENGTLELYITLDHQSLNGGWPEENCATITTPLGADPDMDCVPIASPGLEKSLLAGQTDCWNSVTGNFSCEFEFTVTHNSISQQSVPYDLTDSLPPLTNITGSVTSGNWSCSTISGGAELYCNQTGSPNMTFGATDSFTVLIEGNSPNAPTENCATLSEVTHVDVLAEACVPLPDTDDPIVQTNSVLDISKSIAAAPYSCDLNGGNCSFEMQITNLGPDPFSGPLSFNDTINVAGFNYPSTPVVSVSPSIWSCQPATGTGNDCSATIPSSNSIPVNGSVTVILTVSAPGAIQMHSNNCVTLQSPQQTPPPLDCIGVGFAPMSFLQVYKQMADDTDMAAPPNASFDVNAICGTETYDGTLGVDEAVVLEMGGSTSNCLLSESNLPPLSDQNCVWDAPVFSPSNTVSVPTGEDRTVTVTNRISCNAPLDANVEVMKQYAADSDWVPSSGFVHQMQISCVNPAGQVSYVETVPLDWTGYMGGLPGGSTCTFTEIPDTSDLPQGCTWEAPVFSNGGYENIGTSGFTNFYIENKAVCQNVNQTNLSIEKTFLNGTCINSPSGQCEFLITITNNGPDYTGDIHFDDLVNGGGFGNGSGIGATLTSYNSNEPWTCAQSGQSVNCDVSPINLPLGGSSEITMVLDIPSGAYNIRNCVQIDYPVQNPLPSDCVTDIEPSAMILNPSDTTLGFSWDVGVVTSIPVGGDIITGDKINELIDPVTDSEVLGFEDVYNADIGLRFGATLPLSDRWAMVGGAQYQRFNGSQITLGTIGQQPLTGVMEDMTQFGLDAGVQYSWPEFDLRSIEDVRVYLQGTVGADHISEIRLNNVQMGGRVINSGTIPMYRPSWAAKAETLLGLDIPISEQWRLGIETGLTMAGPLRTDLNYLSSGKPLAGTNNNSYRLSAPLRLKLKTEF